VKKFKRTEKDSAFILRRKTGVGRWKGEVGDNRNSLAICGYLEGKINSFLSGKKEEYV